MTYCIADVREHQQITTKENVSFETVAHHMTETCQAVKKEILKMTELPLNSCDCLSSCKWLALQELLWVGFPVGLQDVALL